MTAPPQPRLEPVGVSVSGVDLSYGATRVLRDVSIEVAPGEFFAFLGPSGCGKTTLLRLIAGFARADRGDIRIGGRDVAREPPWRRDVGMVFQSYALWPHMTVGQNVAFGLEERRVPRAQVRERVAEALRLVGLERFADRRPSQLSGGQQQRVARARTIVVRPKVLLLDEPLSNLDAKLRVQVRRELRDLQRTLGLTTIFVTHDQEEANAICDRIAVLNEGEVQQVGTPVELYDAPANEFVAGFLGTANLVEGTVEGAPGERRFVVAGAGQVPLGRRDIAGRATLMLRPHECRLAPAGAPLADSAARLEGRLRYREFLGAIVRCGIDVGGRDVLVDVPHAGDAGSLDVGAPVVVTFDTARARLFPKAS